MTTLKLSDADGGQRDDLQVRVPWKYVAVWVLSAAVGANGLRSFVTPAPAPAPTAAESQAIKDLTDVVTGLRIEVARLSAQIAEMKEAQNRGRR